MLSDALDEQEDEMKKVNSCTFAHSSESNLIPVTTSPLSV